MKRTVATLIGLLISGCTGGSTGGAGGGSGGGAQDCSCSISHNAVTQVLACSTTACVNGESFRCGADASINDLGACTSGSGGGVGGGEAGGGTGGSGGAGGESGGGGGSSDGGWTAVDLSTTSNLTSVRSPFQPPVYVVGSGGFCATFLPQAQVPQFQPCNIPGAAGKNFTALTTATPTQTVVADDGTTWIRDQVIGEAFTWKTGPVLAGAPRAIGSFVNYAYVFGDQSLAQAIDLGTTPKQSLPFTGAPAAIGYRGAAATFANNAEQAWAVGTQGTISRYDGSAGGRILMAEVSPTTETLNAVMIRTSGTTITEVIAAGDNGTVLTRSLGGSWSVQPTPVTAHLYGLFEGPSGVYAVGAAGTILVRTGTTWTVEPSGVTATLRSGSAVISGRIHYFIAGDNGTFLRR